MMMQFAIVRIAFVASVLLGVVFWQRPGSASHAWPSAIPVFAQSAPTFSVEMKNGTSVVSVTSQDSPEALLETAAAAYRAKGWAEAPIRTSDMRLFLKGEAVAAIQVQAISSGSCLTAIQRPRGI